MGIEARPSFVSSISPPGRSGISLSRPSFSPSFAVSRFESTFASPTIIQKSFFEKSPLSPNIGIYRSSPRPFTNPVRERVSLLTGQSGGSFSPQEARSLFEPNKTLFQAQPKRERIFLPVRAKPNNISNFEQFTNNSTLSNSRTIKAEPLKAQSIKLELKPKITNSLNTEPVKAPNKVHIKFELKPKASTVENLQPIQKIQIGSLIEQRKIENPNQTVSAIKNFVSAPQVKAESALKPELTGVKRFEVVIPKRGLVAATSFSETNTDLVTKVSPLVVEKTKPRVVTTIEPDLKPENAQRLRFAPRLGLRTSLVVEEELEEEIEELVKKYKRGREEVEKVIQGQIETRRSQIVLQQDKGALSIREFVSQKVLDDIFSNQEEEEISGHEYVARLPDQRHVPALKGGLVRPSERLDYTWEEFKRDIEKRTFQERWRAWSTIQDILYRHSPVEPAIYQTSRLATDEEIDETLEGEPMFIDLGRVVESNFRLRSKVLKELSLI